MAEHLVNSETPEEIGDVVASHFADGESYVHLKGLSFAKNASVKRNRQIAAVCGRIGMATRLNADFSFAVERLDEDTERQLPKNHFHTSGASLMSPEKVVSYWNGQPMSNGDIIDVLPIGRVVERMEGLAEKDPHMQIMLERIQERCEVGIAEPIFNSSTGKVRFDKDVLDIKDMNRVDLFYSLINEERLRIDARDKQQELADSIELAGGDALFFKNDEVLHRRRLSKTQGRLAFRVLLDTYLNVSKATVEDVVSVGPYL